MLDRHSITIVPEQLVQLCMVGIQSKKQSNLEICQVVEQDQFLSLYLKNIYRDHWQRGGVMTLLKSIGWEGLRNAISEAYLHQYLNHKFPRKIESDLISDTIDFERRFDFLSSSGNQRTFLLGHLLNQTNLELEEQGLSVLVPIEVDDILNEQKSKTSQPDWLIIATWGLVELLGADSAKESLEKSKGQWEKLTQELNNEQKQRFVSHLLSYGHAIADHSFFITETV